MSNKHRVDALQPQQFTVHGTVTWSDGASLAGATVRAVNWDRAGEDPLGEDTTQSDGRYEISYTADQFRRSPGEVGGSNLIVCVYDAQGLLLANSTRKNNAQADETIDLTVSVLEQKPLADSFIVRGQILKADGSPLTGGIVRAFDKDLRHEQPLGKQTTTDQEGRYEITYAQVQFRRAEKIRADLIVRVFDRVELLLAASQVIFNAQPVEVVNLAIGGGEFRGPSEYEQLMAELTPILDGAQLVELNQEDIAFIEEETGMDPHRLAFLILSDRLASETRLPAGAFYGLFRQRLPTTLLPLLRYSSLTWRRALENALDENIIPTRLRADMDNILDRLQQIAISKEVGELGPGTPQLRRTSRLKYDLLNRSVLDNLKGDHSNKAFINENLNDRLRGLLADALSEHDFSTLAAFTCTMTSVDLSDHAQIPLRTFMEDQIAKALPENSSIRHVLNKAVQKLSTTTTLAQLLGLDQPIQTHPLFETEANQLTLRTLLDTALVLANHQLQETFIERYSRHEGPIEDFWKNLRMDTAFQVDNLVDDLQFTLQLSLLTRNNVPLIKTLRQQFGDITTARQLTTLGFADWKSLISSTTACETVSIPETIPGVSTEEKIDNYARSIISVVERAFPTEYVVQGIDKTPEIDLRQVQHVLAQYPNLNPKSPLSEDLDLSEISSPEHTRTSFEALRREINTFPDFDYQSLLTRSETTPFQNPIRNQVARFFANSPDFDFQTARVTTYLADHGETAMHGIDEQDRPLIIAQLKRMERVFQVTPRNEQMQALQGEGLDSAYSIISIPQKNFVHLMADKLGGEAITHTIYRTALTIVSATQQVFLNNYQAITDVFPFVLGGGNLNERLRLQESNEVSPTLKFLFDSLELCDCEHCQSVYGPSSYFVDLLQFLNPKLSSSPTPLDVLLRRRLDLTHIKLNCDNAITMLPYVDLVNEILECYVAYGSLNEQTVRNTENITADELKANPQYTIDAAYDILKRSVSPFHLPFNRNIEAARVWLEHLGIGRYQVMQLFQAEQIPACAVAAEFLKISPEEFQLLTGKSFGRTNAPPLLPKLSLNASGAAVRTLQQILNAAGISPPLAVDGQFGSKTYTAVRAFQRQYELVEDGVVRPQTWTALKKVKPDLFHPFSPPLSQVSEVLQSMNISYLELVELLKTHYINPDPKSAKAIVLTSQESECDLSVTRLQYADSSALDKVKWQKLNKFIRLWRKLGWSMSDLDKTMTALQVTDITTAFVPQLAQIERLKVDLKIPVVKLLSLWSTIDTHRNDAFYDKLFQNRVVLNPVLTTFKLKEDRSDLEQTNQNLTPHLPAIAAAAMVRVGDLEAIRRAVRLEGDENNDDDLNLENISHLYRYTVLAGALKLSAEDLISLKTLSGIDPFQTPEETLKFVELVQKVKQSGFTVTQFNYLYRHLSPAPASLFPQQESLLLLGRTLRDGLTRISNETAPVDDPTGEVTQTALAYLFEPEIADKVVRMVLDTAAIYTVSLNKLLDGITFPDDIPDDIKNKIAYDPSAGKLRFTGLMTQSERDSLIAVSVYPDYQSAIYELYQQSADHIQQYSGFIDNTLSGFLETSEATAHLLRDSSVDSRTGKPDARAIADKFAYIQENLMPYVRDQLSRSLVKQTLSESLQLDSLTVEFLLETGLKSTEQSGDAAISDVLALQTSGLTASYYKTNDLTDSPDVSIVPDIAFDGMEKTHEPTIPQEIRTAQWEGMIAVPKSEEYTFFLRTNGSVKLWVGEESKPIVEAPPDPSGKELPSYPVPLKAGQLHNLRLEVSQFNPDSPRIVELYWKSATTPKDPVPSANLYPKSIFDTFSTTFTLLHKIALLANGFQLTAPEIAHLSTHPEDFGDFSLQQLPLERAEQNSMDTAAIELFRQWQRLYDYVALRDSLPGGETGLIDLFRLAAAETKQDALSEVIIKQLAVANNQDFSEFNDSLANLSDLQIMDLMLAIVTGWDVNELTRLTGTEGLDIGVDDFKNEITLARVQACMQMIRHVGVSALTLFRWADTELTSGQVQEIKNTIKAKYDDEAWPTIAGPLNDKLRESQKAALIDYVLAKDEIRQQDIYNANQLFEYFLIDVNMSACMMTSRLKQAIASVQLFVHRCLMNLEPDVSPDAIDDDQWEWMKRYRVWEANRKVFLYPENWIEPELRDDKSPFFKELESELLQNDLTVENVEKAYLHYLQKLDEVARLDICGMYQEGEEDGRDQGDEILHVFGRTFSTPHIYYYRKWSNLTETWTPWEKVNLNIDEAKDGGVHLIPVVFNRRLYLFWPIFMEKPDEEQSSGEGGTPRTHWEIQLAWSEYWQNKWSPKHVSKDPIISKPYTENEDPIIISSDKENTPDEVVCEEVGEPVVVKPEDGGIFDFQLIITEECSKKDKIITTNVSEILYRYYLPQPHEHFFRAYKKDHRLLIGVFQAIHKASASQGVIQNTIRDTEERVQRFMKISYYKYNFGIRGELLYEIPLGIHTRLINKDTEYSKQIINRQSVLLENYFSSMDCFDYSASDNKIEISDISPSKIFKENMYDSIQQGLNSVNEYMSYVSTPSATDFSLITESRITILGKIALSYRNVLVPHQRPLPFIQESSFYPFFYKDGQRTYFVRPVTTEEEESPLMVPDGIKTQPPRMAEINLDDIYKDLGIDEIFEKEFLVSNGVTVSPRLSPTTYMSNGAIPFDMAHPSVETPMHTMMGSKKISISNRVKVEKLKFEIHYHPYVSKLIETLNRDGLPELLKLENQIINDGGDKFRHLYEPRDIVHPTRPVENVDFNTEPTDSGAYSIYNWELFFNIPLLIATRLTRDQRFDEAQKWFHYIFNPMDNSLPETQDKPWGRYWNVLFGSSDSASYSILRDKPWSRYWKVLPFRKTERERLEDMLEALSYQGNDPQKKERKEKIAKQVDEWREDPFKPHLVARSRLIAYQKTVVMKYIDNLIQWGDRLFHQDTIESINEATQLYILAYNILGQRPENIPKSGEIKPETYDSLKNKLDSFSNALVVPLENEFSVITSIAKSLRSEVLYQPQVTMNNVNVTKSIALHSVDTGNSEFTSSSFIQMQEFGGYKRCFLNRNLAQFVKFIVTENDDAGKILYFCIPQNDTLLEYWDTVEDRMFKIRHCMNIEGMERQLPLYQPPIDPALLVQAVAKGIDLSSVLNDMNAPLPYYRFSYMLQKAQELCAEVKSLGAALLAALEKKDAEELAVTRAKYEKGILEVMRDVKEKQINEAQSNKLALEKTKNLIKVSLKFYGDRKKEKEDNYILPQEEMQISQLDKSQEDQQESQSVDILSAGLGYMPNYTLGEAGVSSPVVQTTWGSSNLISAFAAYSRSLSLNASRHSYFANLASIFGQRYRRAEDWLFQFNRAEKELEQVEQQIMSADIRKTIAEQELINHDRQIENATYIEEFLRDKYTNQELYNWMIGQISAVFFQSYKMAYDLAKRAEKGYRFERGLTNSNFIQFGYWDNLRKGLLAGEQLYYGLKRLDIAYLEENKREYEITKHISLLQLDPIALIALKETGQCVISLPEHLFDMDFPGHYMRRIKNVSITIPCVTGPYTSINCTLTLLSNETRIKSTPTDPYKKNISDDDNRFVTNFASMQSIATSTAQNDSGLFELNFRDERYLPFEGSGVISEWQLELPANMRQFDYDTISDVILHLRYTAREGGGLLKNWAVDNIMTRIKEAQAAGSVRLFSVRHEFSTEWAKFTSIENVSSDNPARLTLNLKPEHYPFWSKDLLETVKQVELFAKTTVSVEVSDKVDASGKLDEAIDLGGSLGEIRTGKLAKTEDLSPTGPLTIFFGNNSMEDLWLALTWGKNKD